MFPVSMHMVAGMPSLQEMCQNVITSCLLETQQWKLEPDKLFSLFPDNVPTALRKSIVHSFKCCTLQLGSFDSPSPRPSPTPSEREAEEIMELIHQDPLLYKWYYDCPMPDMSLYDFP